MEVCIYVAEVRIYGPGERLGRAKPVWRTLTSFDPIPKSQVAYHSRRAGLTETFIHRTTGGEEPSHRLKTLGGEWSTWEPRCLKLPRSNWLRAEALLARFEAGERDVFLAPERTIVEARAPHFPIPSGPVVPAVQVGFAW